MDEGLTACPKCGQRTVEGAECQWCDQPLGDRKEPEAGGAGPGDGSRGRQKVLGCLLVLFALALLVAGSCLALLEGLH